MGQMGSWMELEHAFPDMFLHEADYNKCYVIFLIVNLNSHIYDENTRPSTR